MADVQAKIRDLDQLRIKSRPLASAVKQDTSNGSAGAEK